LRGAAATTEAALRQRADAAVAAADDARRSLAQQQKLARDLADELDRSRYELSTRLLEAQHEIGRLKDRLEACVCGDLGRVQLASGAPSTLLWCKPQYAPVRKQL